MNDAPQEISADPSAELPSVKNADELSRIICALVFASPEVLTLKKLRNLLGDYLSASVVQNALRKANESFARIDAPFELVEQGGGYRFRTRAAYFPWVKLLFPEMNFKKLSGPALDTLAIIAYKQPITRAELENVRGVSCDGPLRYLLDKNLVKLGPRAETIGRPYTYLTTPEFLKHFGINRIPDDLPRLTEFTDILQASPLMPQYAQPESEEALSAPLEEDGDDLSPQLELL
jgi:segregation and condensation protein B